MATFPTLLLNARRATLALLAASLMPPVWATNETSAGAPGLALFSSMSPGRALGAWQFQPVRGAKHRTLYSLVRDDDIGSTVLEATADAAAGALIWRFDADARVDSILRFMWKPGGLIASSDPKSKAGDDYVARIYITFAYDRDRASAREKAENAIAHMLYGETPPHAALSYVFTHKAALGATFANPYTTRVKMIVVDADPQSVGQWKRFVRNIYDDYKRAFGEEPTRISGIAIMVDTDNTGEKASARFGDITLGPK
ncbi:MAG: DUF3047 domain-containing protein [Burkholderiales bacterium]|nr:DUF3047 domain-containing protein [Burkholderiales bacterium]